MTATLRVVLDHAVPPSDPDAASLALARELAVAAPRGCEVEAIVSADGAEAAASVPGIARVHRLPLKRAQFVAACALGMIPGIGGGMIHSSSLLAPLVRHDRVHDNDQTVVTLWDLDALTAPQRLSKQALAWQKTMIKRAQRHADAVVVPTHAMADVLGERTKLGDRVRVIAGASTGAVAAERAHEVGDGRAILLDAERASAEELSRMFAALSEVVDAEVVALVRGDDAAVRELASAAGLPEHRFREIAPADEGPRAEALAAASVFVDPAAGYAYPWRMLDALRAGVPIVAARSPQNIEVLADAGVVVDADDSAAVVDAIASVREDEASARRSRVLSGDRARAFSWRDSADRVWQLHAEL
ncbi:glycosyltransferase [Microbacterium limosum]|uniref:Glycosyltransferase n=1 Tax=Microbacterium limosum TaxID=3079935 RepID=A0AAU0MF40_9MICO|nr:glycosyltransferase [Microbacterium sp. Y20]WOQ68829.1 glycosyltransferase [Microbacterium sp. Y20]